MDFERTFRSQLNANVALEPLASRDNYGEPTYGTAATYRVWLSRKPRQVRTATGEERVSSAALFFSPYTVVSGALVDSGMPTVTPESRITLPDGTQPPILSVAELTDPDGHTHLQVFV